MFLFDKGIKIVDKTMKELGIKYSFISGTALGLGREGKCLDFDTDIDFCIHSSNRNNLENINTALIKNGLNRISTMSFGERVEALGYEIIDNKGEQDEWVEMDILHSRGDSVWYSAKAGDVWITKVYPKSMWENLTHIQAYGINCPVFSPIDRYLEMCYGNDWRTSIPDFWTRDYFPKTEARSYNYDLQED